MQKFKIEAYFALAAAFLQPIDKINAQVKFVDIIPNEIIEGDFDFFDFDFDNDSINDIYFMKFFIRSYDYPFGSCDFDAIAVGGLNGLSIIATTSFYFTGYGTHIDYFPLALSAHKLINSDTNFESRIYQKMVYKRNFGTSGPLNSKGNWAPDVEDKYIGFRYTDPLNLQYYGWVRCSVREDGEQLIVQAYAYELTPNHPIVTGSIEHYVGLQESPNTLQASVYSFNQIIYIHQNTTPQLATQITLLDITGKTVYTETAHFTTKQLALNLPKGIYMVELLQDEKRFLQKVYL